MRVYLLQRPIVWEEPKTNFLEIESRLDSAPPDRGSLLVLAEMFSTGFSFALDRVGEPEHGITSEFLRHLAMKFQVATVGSFPHRPTAGTKGLNRLLAYRPDGTVACYYDKIHPFSYGKEADHYVGGTRLPLFEHGGWTICPTICYDLRFPELYRRATLEGGANLFLCVANWPKARREHWNALVRARAIENQAVMVAVNRMGSDPLHEYSGDSQVLDARGRDVLQLNDAHEYGWADLDLDDCLDWRKRFPALADATYDFVVCAPE